MVVKALNAVLLAVGIVLVIIGLLVADNIIVVVIGDVVVVVGLLLFFALRRAGSPPPLSPRARASGWSQTTCTSCGSPLGPPTNPPHAPFPKTKHTGEPVFPSVRLFKRRRNNRIRDVSVTSPWPPEWPRPWARPPFQLWKGSIAGPARPPPPDILPAQS